MAWITLDDGTRGFMGPKWENHPIDGHPLIGTTHTFRDDLPVPANPYEGKGTLIVSPGMDMRVIAVFRNWNGYKGLDMLYARCYATGEATHVTPDDLGVTL